MIDPDIMEAFVSESREHLANVEDDILALERGPVDVATVNHLFRSLHTVKGASGFVGLGQTKNLAHALEDVVGRVRSGELTPGSDVVDALLTGVDRLKQLIEGGEEEGLEVSEEVIALEALVDGAVRADAPPATPESGSAHDGSTVAPDPEHDVADEGFVVTAEDLSPESSVRISLSILDKLMNLATELVLVRNQNAQAVETGDRDQLVGTAQRLSVVTSELQASIMRTRMRPVGTVFGRFQRLVRDFARSVQKEVGLEIAGADVELDKSIIEAIGDPLTHLVRNAVDHGMEDAATRERLGKPARGTVRLSAFHQSGRVNIRVQDDGSGMDPAELREIAVSKGLITSSQAETMPDRDAYNLIFLPGFTRAPEVTDLSGRGVGMDVVKTAFKKLGGSVEVASRTDEGTTITIVLPLTLAIVPALIVAVGKVCFAVPQSNIDEVVWLHGEDLYQGLKKVDDQEVYWLREHLLPVLRLSRILGIPLGYMDPSSRRELSDRREQEPDRRSRWIGVDTDSRDGPVERRQSHENSAYILVIRSGEERYGLLVERIVDTEEIVVKSLHDQMKGCGAYSGTTVLGDGRIAMILDVGGVAEVGNLRFPEREDDSARARASADARQTLLLFDIGGKECFAMPLSLVSRVEEIRPNDIHSANGRRYFEFRGQPVPLLALENCLPDTKAGYRDDDVYVIMPRGQRPIGLLAARILDTRELDPEAELRGPELTGILGSTLIDGRLTTILDLVPLIESVDPNWFAPEGASGRRVLLIEDSSFFASMITPGIRGVGLDVVWVPDAESGLELLESERFETVVCDIELPGISGLEFARKVRADEGLRSQPMVAISALETPALDAEALAAGFDRFVSKLDQGLLFRALEFLCTGKVPVRGGEVA